MDDNELKSLYDHCSRVENLPDDRVVWAIWEYKEKLENRQRYYIHCPNREFTHVSTCIWALDEILARVSGKSLRNALNEVSKFRDFLGDYDGKSKTNRKIFGIAADVAHSVYEMLVAEFNL